MKKFFRALLALLAVALLGFPLAGYLYMAIMALAGVATIFHLLPGPVASILQYGWKIYVGCALVTLFVMTTFTYQNCCLGLKTFWGHIRHCGITRHLDVLAVALLWPFMWNVVARNVASWQICWLDIVDEAFRYWFVTKWKGVRVDIWSSTSGKTETFYTHSPHEAREIATKSVVNFLDR